MEVGHHHNTQILWSKYDIVWNDLQAKKCQSEFGGITGINRLV